MDVKPPAGSRITIASDGLDPIIVIPKPNSPMVHIAGLVMAILLLGGVPAFISVASKVLSGNGNMSLVLWMGLWTPGLLFSAYALYRVLHRPVPETLILKRDGVRYDSGVVPALLNGKEISFPKGVRIDLDRHQLQSLRLRGNVVGDWRLTVDVDANRVDIAANASGVECEWLARLLAGRYSVQQVWASPNDV
jgi:hypothetical protein